MCTNFNDMILIYECTSDLYDVVCVYTISNSHFKKANTSRKLYIFQFSYIFDLSLIFKLYGIYGPMVVQMIINEI